MARVQQALKATSPPPELGYRLLRIAQEQYGLPPAELNPEQQHQAEQIAAKELILEQTVLQSKEAREVVVPASEVKKALGQIRDRYESTDAFHETLSANNLDEAAMETALARELRVEAVLDYVSSKVDEVDDTEVRLFYYMHREKFHQPETRTARHILITINPDFPENTRESASQRLMAIAKRLRKTPHRFEEQALKHSECPTSLQGGLLGQIKPGILYPELEKPLFAMNEGELSDIIESPLGLHLLFCEQIHPETTVPLVEVRDKLRQTLTDRQRSTFQKRWLKSLLASQQSAASPGG